jgi:hypothetical protein
VKVDATNYFSLLKSIKIVMWRNEFARFYELYELSDQSHPDNYFSKVFQQKFVYYREGTRMSFGPLEKALDQLDAEAWKQLKGKALPLVTQKNPRREWSQLFNHLYEAFGYEWLAKEGYTDIQFVARRDKQSERTPELFGKSSTSKAILEVKTINRSEQEIDRLEMFPRPVLDLTQGLSDGFKNKFLDDIKNAREQLEKFDVPTDRKIVLVIIRPDFEFWCNDKIYKEIDEMASKLCAPGFEVTVHQLVR